MKKVVLKILMLVVLWLAVLVVFALTSCSASHHLKVDGYGVVITNDTIHVHHGGFLNSKNYVPYD